MSSSASPIKRNVGLVTRSLWEVTYHVGCLPISLVLASVGQSRWWSSVIRLRMVDLVDGRGLVGCSEGAGLPRTEKKWLNASPTDDGSWNGLIGYFWTGGPMIFRRKLVMGAKNLTPTYADYLVQFEIRQCGFVHICANHQMPWMTCTSLFIFSWHPQWQGAGMLRWSPSLNEHIHCPNLLKHRLCHTVYFRERKRANFYSEKNVEYPSREMVVR